MYFDTKERGLLYALLFSMFHFYCYKKKKAFGMKTDVFMYVTLSQVMNLADRVAGKPQIQYSDRLAEQSSY